MKKKQSRIRHHARQRQKMSRRTVMVIAASCMTCAIVGLTIFFNMSRVDKSMADTRNQPVKILMIEDEEPVTVKNQPVAIVKPTQIIDANTQIVRSPKVVNTNAQDQQN
ncbi:MAG: hypothetical protein NTV09_12610 [Bacteroidetes bacterium]|nr:hypothetical protein [Bacteroidota bacterium]